MSHSYERLNTEPKKSRSGNASCLQILDALVRRVLERKAKIWPPSQPGRPRRRTVARGLATRIRLIPAVLTAAMVLSVAVMSAAPVTLAVGAPGSSEHNAATAQSQHTFARLVLSPAQTVIRPGARVTYTAALHEAAIDYPGDVTKETTFSISPGGSCAGAVCTAKERGWHIVTGTVDLDGYTISATSALLVVPTLTRVEVTPQNAVAEVRHSVIYTAHGLDSEGQAVLDLTAYTRFSISPDGFCAGNTCTAMKPGLHKIIGLVDLGDDSPLRGNAVLLAEAALTLHPDPATITAGESVTYQAYRNPQGEVTTATVFSIGPDGSCDGDTCTATSAGDHTVTGTVNVRNHQITGTATLRVNRKVTAGGSVLPTPSPSGDGGSASPFPSPSPSSTAVATAFPHCPPAARQIRGLRVAPRRGPPGTLVRITAKLNRAFAGCPLALLLGGSRFGGDTTVGRNGSVSDRRAVPNDAKPGHTRVALARTDGRTLATTSFAVLPKPSLAALPHRERLFRLLLAGAVLLLTGLAGAAVTGERARRQRRWVGQHVRVEPNSRPGHMTADLDPNAKPTLAIRLQPRGGTGTTEITKEGD